jgi:phosphate-selective porin OprO/OprP
MVHICSVLLALTLTDFAVSGQELGVPVDSADPAPTFPTCDPFGSSVPNLQESLPAATAMRPMKSTGQHLPKFKLRGRIDTDFLWSDQTNANRETYGDLGDTVGLRRARIGAEGHFSPESRYVGELDLATGQVVIRDLYLGLGKVSDQGEFKFGHLREPFSLEGGTSANTFAFMERSLINVLDPARNWGVAYVKCGDDELWTVSGGVFASGTDSNDFLYGQGSTTDFTAKWTGLAWYENQGRNLMHFGLVLSERIANKGLITVNEQPQSPLLDVGDSSNSPFIPKLKIPATDQQLANLQWAYVRDSFWAQAEWYGTLIDQIGGGTIFFHGSYLDLGYFLTGEHRKYLTNAGLFGPVSVRRPFVADPFSKSAAEEMGYGAFEATCRISYADFIDGNTPGGPPGTPVGVQTPMTTIGMNWYLADHLRLMFNYSYAVPYEATTGASSASVFGMRLAMFW